MSADRYTLPADVADGEWFIVGAVRAFNEVSARLAAVQPVIDTARPVALYLNVAEIEVTKLLELVRVLAAAVDALDAVSPLEGPKQ